MSYYRPYRGWLFADMAAAALVSAIALALPLCTRYLLNNVLEPNPPDALNRIYMMAAVMVGLIVLHMLGVMFVDYQGHLMGAKMERDMRNDLLEHYLKQSDGFYDDQKTGQLMSRITHDLFWLSELYHHGPEEVFISFMKLVGSFTILMIINVRLALILFFFMPVMVMYAVYFNRKVNAALKRAKERTGDINAQVEDTLAGIRVVKSFTNETLEREKFAHHNNRYMRSRGDGYRLDAFFHSGMIAFTQLFTVVVVIFGGIGIVQGNLDLPDLVTFLLYVGLLIEPIQKTINFSIVYQEGITGFSRFMDMLEVQPDIHDADEAVDLQQVRGNIEFRDVRFRYSDHYSDVLKRISLDIKAGDYVALVGSSGVGKTTLCSLIPRFYDVTDGEILLDGQPIRDVSLRSLREHIGVVQQDVYLFAGTIADNIRYGKPDATEAEVIAAARQANAHDFIMALPQGYGTDIGQRGVKLSGGQKQRLSIARVFLKNPPILIFDEATSALDNESEKAVQDSLEALADNRTTLVIAHRLSTIRNAQRIVVLADGDIHEQGTHEALIESGGTYANLYNMQLKI